MDPNNLKKKNVYRTTKVIYPYNISYQIVTGVDVTFVGVCFDESGYRVYIYMFSFELSQKLPPIIIYLDETQIATLEPVS